MRFTTAIVFSFALTAFARRLPDGAPLAPSPRRAGRGVRGEGRSVTFTLPNGEGSFRGEVRGDRIVGHWIQPWFATPVTLVRVSPSRWRGTVAPLDEHMTLFLPFTKNADGTCSAFLIRNPGEKSVYCSCQPNLLGGVLGRTT